MEKRSTFSVYFYLKKHRTNSDGEIPIYLRISVNTQRAEMSMHMSIDEKSWNASSGRAIGSTKKIKEINSFLESARSTMFEHYKYLRETGKPLSAVAIKNAYLGIFEEEDKGKKILELFQEHNDKVRALSTLTTHQKQLNVTKPLSNIPGTSSNKNTTVTTFMYQSSITNLLLTMKSILRLSGSVHTTQL